MKLNYSMITIGLIFILRSLTVQAELTWVAEKGADGGAILEWFSSPEALEGWYQNLNSGTEGEAAGEVALDFLRHYEDRIPSWAEPAAEETIRRIGQLQNMLDVFVDKGGYRNLALADMTARVVYVGVVRALLSTQIISPELEQLVNHAMQYEIPIEKWRLAVLDETGWSNSDIEERERMWVGQMQNVPITPSRQEARQIQFYTLAYAATGGKSMADKAFASLFRVLPDYYYSAKTYNLMLMYTKIEYLFRFSLPALCAYIKADPNRVHLNEVGWIQARVGKALYPMLSAPSIAGAAEEIREVIRASSLKSHLEIHAGIIWASQPDKLLVP